MVHPSTLADATPFRSRYTGVSVAPQQCWVGRLRRSVVASDGSRFGVWTAIHVSIELKHLRYAEAAERYGSFRKAADSFSVRQSNLSCRVFSLANAVLLPLIAGYSWKFPAVEIHLREGLHNSVRDDVRSGLADFGIGYVDDARRPSSPRNWDRRRSTWLCLLRARFHFVAQSNCEHWRTSRSCRSLRIRAHDGP